MGISTGKGDGGYTEAGGKALPKQAPLIDALGSLDELQAFLSLATHAVKIIRSVGHLEAAISGLSRVMAALAASGVQDIGPELRKEFEKAISDYEGQALPTNFVLPGRNRASAELDVCRTVCRRAERRVCALKGRPRPEIMKLLNRLSDWLYLAARAEERPSSRRKRIPAA